MNIENHYCGIVILKEAIKSNCSEDQDVHVLFRMPAAVGGARADAVPVDVGALGTRVAAWDEDPPFAILVPALPGSCCWSTDSDAAQPS